MTETKIIYKWERERAGETVIITGGAQRLGLYNAERLAEEGYRAVVTYRRKRDTLKYLEEKGIGAIQAGFSTEKGIDDFINAVLKTHSTPRAVIHNASLWFPDNLILEGKERFSDLVNVHMLAPFKINYAFKPLPDSSPSAMKDIIHMTDFTVFKGSGYHAAYSGTKAALENMTLSFSAMSGPGIQINNIAPALVKFNAWDDEEYRKAAAKKSIMGFEPGEAVACQAVSYLMNSPYVTGTCLHLDGGRHLV